MERFVYADPNMSIGDIVALAGTGRGAEVVVTSFSAPFTATREDEDVWALDAGSRYQRIEFRPLSAEENEEREFARNPRQALYNSVMRRGAAHTGGDMQKLGELDHDVRNQTALYRDGDLVVAERRVHVYDGNDLLTRRALALADLSAPLAGLAQELSAVTDDGDDDDWETL